MENPLAYTLYRYLYPSDGSGLDSFQYDFFLYEDGFFLTRSHVPELTPKSNIPDCPYSAESFILSSNLIDCLYGLIIVQTAQKSLHFLPHSSLISRDTRTAIFIFLLLP